MDIIQELKKDIADPNTRIVYPEGEEPEILKTASRIKREGIAVPVLVGSTQSILKAAEALDIDLTGIGIIDPANDPVLDRYVEAFGKDSKLPKAVIKSILSKRLAFGCMMVKEGDADLVVAGIAHPTEEVILTGQLIIGMQEGISTPSSFMLMDVPGYQGEEGSLLVFTDASVNPDPTPDQLADIAITTAGSVKAILGWEPRVAMLSFSTCGSASHPHVDKVLEALEITRKRAPELKIDGEFQIDTAIVKDVAQRKMKRPSDVAGRANVLVFPDLDAANMGYKITQRLGNAAAYGMVLQGFAKPVSDLSRGATAEDVYGLSVMLVAGIINKNNKETMEGYDNGTKNHCDSRSNV